MYIFAIIFMQAGISYITDGNSPGELEIWYGSLDDTIFSLIMAISGGLDWGLMWQPLVLISPYYRIVYVFYVFFVVFGVMNVLTGVFLESAAEVLDRDLLCLAHRA